MAGKQISRVLIKQVDQKASQEAAESDLLFVGFTENESLFLDLDWDSVLQEAAEGFAKGFAEALGAGIAAALIDHLLGRGDERGFNEEVISSLRRIEELQRQTLSLIRQLPKKIDEDAMLRELEKIAGRASTIRSRAANYEVGKTSANAAQLVHEVGEAQALGISIINHKNDKAWYLGLLNMWAAIMPAFSVLGPKFHRGNYREYFSDLIDQSIENCRLWLGSGTVFSFPDSLEALRKRLPESIQLLDEIRAENSAPFVVAVSGPWPHPSGDDYVVYLSRFTIVYPGPQSWLRSEIIRVAKGTDPIPGNFTSRILRSVTPLTGLCSYAEVEKYWRDLEVSVKHRLFDHRDIPPVIEQHEKAIAVITTFLNSLRALKATLGGN